MTLVHHDAQGAPVTVIVSMQECPSLAGRGCAMFVSPANAIVYLARNERLLPHELAHVAGMTHSAWQKNGFGIECAVVDSPGYETVYRKGDVICGGFDGSDFIERH